MSAARTPLQEAVAGLDDDTLAYLLIAAVRYQLPRLTYGSGIVGSAGEALAPHLSPRDAVVIASDVSRQFAD